MHTHAHAHTHTYAFTYPQWWNKPAKSVISLNISRLPSFPEHGLSPLVWGVPHDANLNVYTYHWGSEDASSDSLGQGLRFCILTLLRDVSASGLDLICNCKTPFFLLMQSCSSKLASFLLVLLPEEGMWGQNGDRTDFTGSRMPSVIKHSLISET